jgi:hypothetical protein
VKTLSEKIHMAIWYAFVLVVVAYSSVIGWWLLYPYDPVTVEKPIRIMNPLKQVKAGGILVYKITYNKKMDIQGTLTRKLVNSYKMDLMDSRVTAPVGKDCDMIPVNIPSFADPGIYYLWWSAEYQVNPLRKITVSVESEKFEVINNHEANREPKGDKGEKGEKGR